MHFCTGKPVSEALILESVNPQYDDQLFIELVQVQYTNSLVNADSFCVNFTNTTFYKIPIPHLTCPMEQKFLP